MLDVLWTPLIVFSLWSYIGLNIFRYKYFDYKEEGRNSILFIVLRVIVISTLILYLLLSFKSYVFYCQMKLFWYFVTLIGIVLSEFIYSLFWDDDLLDAYFFLGIIYIGVSAMSLIITLHVLNHNVNREIVDTSTIRYEIITEDKNNVDSKENVEDFYGILGYVDDDGKYYYSCYYLSKDEEEMIHVTLNEKDLNGNIKVLKEGEKPYIEIITEKYTNKEELEKKVYDNNDNAKYIISAPLSVFHGEFNNEEVSE